MVGLLQGTDAVEIWDVMFPHPLVQAAVYEHVAPTVRVRLHRAAAGLAEDAGAALRHRVAATTPPNAELAAALDAFARGEMRWGAWASAASALVEAGRMSVRRDEREERLLRAMDAIVSAGDLPQAFAFARDVARFESGPLRDAALGYLAVLRGRVTEAESLLTMGWKRSDPASDPHLAALLALRWTLHSVGRLRGAEIVEWSRRSMALVPEDDAVRLEAEAILGLGLGLMGRVPDGIAAYEDVLAPLTGDEGSTAGRVWMAKSWLQLVVDDLDGIPQTLAEVARDQLGGGSVRIAVWAHVWRSRALFLLGDWDDAAASAERAVSLLEETGHDLLRPLARWVAVSVPTGRGEWAAAEAHAERAVADRGDYELMIVAAALAAAEPAWARGDHEGVLGALAPVRAIQPRQGSTNPASGRGSISTPTRWSASGGSATPRSSSLRTRRWPRSAGAARPSRGWHGCAGVWKRRPGGWTPPRPRSGMASTSSTPTSSTECRCRSSERCSSWPMGRCCGAAAAGERRPPSWTTPASASTPSAPVPTSSAATWNSGASGASGPGGAPGNRADSLVRSSPSPGVSSRA